MDSIINKQKLEEGFASRRGCRQWDGGRQRSACGRRLVAREECGGGEQLRSEEKLTAFDECAVVVRIVGSGTWDRRSRADRGERNGRSRLSCESWEAGLGSAGCACAAVARASWESDVGDRGDRGVNRRRGRTKDVLTKDGTPNRCF